MTFKEKIVRHTNGTGTGFEIDDLLSDGSCPQDTIDKILFIEEKYRNDDYPIGISNPASFQELLELAN
jgi:hypothetical protein